MKEKGPHGGARPGAGRKPENRKGYTVRLSTEEHEEFLKRGGSNWLRQVLSKESKQELDKSTVQE